MFKLTLYIFLFNAPAEFDCRPDISTVYDLKEDHVTDTTITIAWKKPEDCEEEITAYRITCSLKETEEEDGGDGDGEKEDKEDVSECGHQDDMKIQEEKEEGASRSDKKATKAGDKVKEEICEISDDQEREKAGNQDKESVFMEDDTTGVTAQQDEDKQSMEEGYTMGNNKERGDKQVEEEHNTTPKDQTKKSSSAPLQEIKLYGEDVTGSTFSGLVPETTYVLEVFTICGDYESGGAAVDATTRSTTASKDTLFYSIYFNNNCS